MVHTFLPPSFLFPPSFSLFTLLTFLLLRKLKLIGLIDKMATDGYTSNFQLLVYS